MDKRSMPLLSEIGLTRMAVAIAGRLGTLLRLGELIGLKLNNVPKNQPDIGAVA